MGLVFGFSDKGEGAADLALKCNCEFNPFLIQVGNADAIVLWKVKSECRKTKPFKKGFLWWETVIGDINLFKELSHAYLLEPPSHPKHQWEVSL